jgi:hypothetical protein
MFEREKRRWGEDLTSVEYALEIYNLNSLSAVYLVKPQLKSTQI